MDLVGGDAGADTGGAQHDAPLALAGGYSPCGAGNEIGIVAGCGAVGAEILNFIAFFQKVSL